MDNSADAPKCGKCQEPLPGLAPLGLCPACLVDSGAFPDEGDITLETSIGGDELANLGTVIGRYKLLEVIGEGGFGVVYMAEQREPVRRMVALKVIKLGMDTKQVIARFESERQALALMEHSNIASVHDAGTTATGRPYFVMELVRGIPITKFCDEHHLNTRERLKLFIGVCSAVQHAHQKGIIHRDLKPGNVLVTIDDDGPRPKVIDFGIAKATAQRLTDLTVYTQFNQFLGTPAYTSPEQAQFDARDVDTRSDIYSLGVLLYTLLTGQTPFDQDELVSRGQDAVFKAIREEEPPRPSTRVNALTSSLRSSTAALRKESPGQLLNHLRGDLDKVVMKAMEKDRRRRYETANGFAVDIQRYLNDEPVAAVSPTSIYRIRKWVQRNRGPAMASMAIVFVLLAGYIVSHFQARRAEAGELAARKSFYLADMNVAQQALQSGDLERARNILERQIPKVGEEDLRGWEWRFFQGQAHRHQFHVIADDDPDDNILPDAIFELALSQRGDFMASASRAGVIRLWDLATRKEVYQCKVKAGAHAWVDFSPDGRYLCAGGRPWLSRDRSPETLIYDLDKKVEVERFSTPVDAYQPRFLSDRVVCVGDKQDALCFREIASGDSKLIQYKDRTNDQPSCYASTMAAAPSANRFLTSGYYSKRVFLWDSDSRQILRSIEGRGIGHRMAISPSAHLWALFPKQMPWVDIIDGESGEPLTELRLDFPINDGRFNHDGSILVTADYTGNVQLFDTKTWQEITRYNHWGSQLNTVAVSSDGNLIVSGGEEGSILGWPGYSSGKNKLETGGRIVTGVRYSPDGRLLAVGTSEGRLEIWEIRSAKRQHIIAEQTNKRPTINPMFLAFYNDDFFAFSPDGQHIAVAHTEAGNYSVKILDTTTFKTVGTLPHPAEVKTLEYSPDGQLLATGTGRNRGKSDGTLRVWDLAESEIVHTDPNQFQIASLAFSPDSKLVVCQGWFKCVVWNMETGKQVVELKELSKRGGVSKSIIFSPDGHLLATAGNDRHITLWDTNTWQPVRRMFGHAFSVMDLSFSPDGKRLASSGRDSQCRLWDVESGQEVASFRGYAVDFSPDGNTMAVGGATDFTEKNATEGGSSVRLHRAKTFDEIQKDRDTF